MLPNTPIGTWSLLAKLLRILNKLGPSKLFNIMKAPEQCVVLFRVIESTVGVTIIMAFWAILAFWVSRWGRRYFWISITLQLLYIGIPLCIWIQHSRATSGEFVATAIRLNLTWPLWVFIAGLLLEIMEQMRNRQ